MKKPKKLFMVWHTKDKDFVDIFTTRKAAKSEIKELVTAGLQEDEDDSDFEIVEYTVAE